MSSRAGDPLAHFAVYRVCAAILVLWVTVFACTPGGGGARAPSPPVAGAAPNAAPRTAVSAGDPGDGGPVPIDAASPRWGDPLAPVTLVEFSDLECPFCARVQPTIAELQRRYGPHRLRVVWKHDPLSFHAHARDAALAAQAVRELGGDERFFRFVALVFADQSELEPGALRREATSLGVDAASFDLLVKSSAVTAHVDADIALSGRVGALGTPHFLINGVHVSGAVPLEQFVSVIDNELAEARTMSERGIAPKDIYVARSTENFHAEAPGEDEEDPAPDKTAWNVPIAGSPRLGPDDALVTIVEFSDFQCPFCKRVQKTLAAVRERYGADVRVVWKHLPLPFHPRARPAATLSIEARQKLGDAGFWKAADLLFESSPHLGTEDLARIAQQLKLDWPKVQSAIARDADAAALTEDEGVAADFAAHGTPHFFINGQRLVGAQPLEAFTAIIDAELDAAKKLVASGVPRARVFDELMQKAASPPPPEQKEVPPPTAQNPSRGPLTAKVVVQMFSDFECPYCRRSMKTLDELEKRHPKQIRLVYRNLPLEFHPGARIAAAAALEAYEQGGAEAFWKMASLLEADQDDRAPLTREELTKHATALGLDVRRFERALDEGRHDAAIDADLRLATGLGIQGTPSFVINGYFISGAQPIAVFERTVQRALSDDRVRGAARAK